MVLTGEEQRGGQPPFQFCAVADRAVASPTLAPVGGRWGNHVTYARMGRWGQVTVLTPGEGQGGGKVALPMLG